MTDTDFSKATPRPWRIDNFHDRRILNEGGSHICTAYLFSPPITRGEAEANAALIVAAVNAFDPDREKKVGALVEAIEEVIAATGAYLPPDGISPQECLNRILGATDNKKIVDALHSLKGGENG